MSTQTLQKTLLAILLIVILGSAIIWMNRSYQRMQDDCRKLGGKFYSISFTQNICVDGTVVHELK